MTEIQPPHSRLYITAIIAAILSACVSSLSYPLMAGALHYYSLFEFIFVRSIVATLMYVLFCIKYGLPKLNTLFENKNAAVQVFFFRGFLTEVAFAVILKLVPSVEVMFLTKLEPYLVLFFSWWLLKEKISKNGAALLILHITGAIILATDGRFSLKMDSFGELLLVGLLLMLAYTYQASSVLSKAMGSIHVSGFKALAGTIGGGIGLLISSLWNPSLLSLTLWTPGFLYVVGSVVVWDLLGAPLFYESLKYLPGWLVSALRAVGPVLAAPISVLFFREHLSLFQIGGATLVVITSGLLAVERHREERRKADIILKECAIAAAMKN